ncbi:MAG: tetratricopeptide repeat protein [Bacteroidia bacterium]
MKNKLYKLLLMALVLIQIPAIAQTGKLTEEQRLAFDKVYFKAMKEKMQGNFDDADLSFREAIILDKENANVYYQIAEINFVQKRLKEAVKFAQMAVQLNPKNIWYNNLLAELYKTNREYEKSADLYLVMYDKLKPELNYLYEAATNYFYVTKYSKSIKILDRIEKIIGPKEEVIIKKEQVYLQANKISKAIKEVERLIGFYPLEVKYKGMLADLYLSKKDDKKANEIYNEILRQDPANGYANIALSEYYKSKKDNDLSYSYLKKAIASPDLEIKYKIQILVPFVSPDVKGEKRIQAYELVEIYKNTHKAEASATMLKGDLLAQDSRFDEARKEYRETAKLDASNVTIWQQVLYCDQELNDNIGLLADCESALELFPTEPMFYNYKAMVSLQEKQYEKAIDAALKGVEFVVDNDKLKVQFLSIAADAAHYAKKHQMVDSIYDQALLIEPNSAYALNNYAYFLSLRKVNLEKADSMSYLSLQIEPNSASYLDTYGWILYQKKEYIKAKNYIEQSLKISPKSGEVLDHYGDILYQLGEKENAIESWKKAKENNATSEFLDEKIKQGKLIE